MGTLVAIGCSHTVGTALDGVTGSQNEFNLYNCFAAQIARKMNYQYINLSVPGGSNQSILRKLNFFIADNKNKLKNTFFLIGWTSPARFELRYPENSSHEFITINSWVDKKYIPFTHKMDPKLLHTKTTKDLTYYSPYLFNLEEFENNWAVYVYSAQKVLESFNLDYYMFNTCFGIEKTKFNYSIINKIDKNYILDLLNTDESLLYWSLNRGYEKTECWHLKLDAHTAWANYIYEKIKNAYQQKFN